MPVKDNDCTHFKIIQGSEHYIPFYELSILQLLNVKQIKKKECMVVFSYKILVKESITAVKRNCIRYIQDGP